MIFGEVSLSLHANAKGGEKVTQLALLRQVSPFLQRIHLRAKRKPIPEKQRPDRRLTGAIDRSEMAVADVVNVISGEVV